MSSERTIQEETRIVWATLLCFVLGAVLGALLLWGSPRALAGEGAVSFPAGVVAGLVAALAFAVSTRLHRPEETRQMPGWQALVSTVSAFAVIAALAGVTVLGVLLAGEILSTGLEGLELPTLAGSMLTGAASAIAGRFGFEMGVRLRTADLAGLLFAYLLIGTLFAMITAADPRWWQQHFSQLGSGKDAWVFNGTLVVAGLLVSAVGAYIGRDLHRIRGDADLARIAVVAGSWAGAGIALAAVGVFPLHLFPVAHNLAAVCTLALFLVAAIATTVVLPGRPTTLTVATIAVVVAMVVAVVLRDPFRLYSLTVLEVVLIALALLWLTTLVRVLAVLSPDASRTSQRPALRRLS